MTLGRTGTTGLYTRVVQGLSRPQERCTSRRSRMLGTNRCNGTLLERAKEIYMSHRILICLGALGALIALPLPAQTPSPAAKSSAAPRNRDGHADLEGVWTNATLTPMERPAKFNGKSTVSD